MKQFNNKEEFDKWIDDHFSRTVDEMLYGRYDEDEEADKIVARLKSEGYDLDNLTKDGHAYDIGGHTNNGWLYRHEADPGYAGTIKREIRESKNPRETGHKISGPRL